MSWLMNKPPLRAVGTCGRKKRTDVGDANDHFALLFEYENNVGVTFTSKQYRDGGSNAGNLCDLYGSKGRITTKYGGQVIIFGENHYRGGKTTSIYQEGAVNNIAAFHEQVTKGKCDNPTVAPSARSNLVAVVTNGTAVLGLGNIGPLAAKPVMEGKGVLFKKFADVNVFDLEIAETDPEKFIDIVASLEPTFGGINLEDIKAPECFVIEKALRERMNIPVFHDDQHGTAIISGAALINALTITGRNIEETRVVFSGAGAAGIGCARFYRDLGIRSENMLLCDSHGVIYRGRTMGMNPYKLEFARKTSARTLADALEGADVFAGLSQAGLMTADMVKRMAPNPIIFAMANPDPEIRPEEADGLAAVMATGRSDYPNQINNVLAFPGIFRGALDARATTITEGMKMAAAGAIAAMVADEDVHPNYVVPSVFDKRVAPAVAAAVAEVAIREGVVRETPAVSSRVG